MDFFSDCISHEEVKARFRKLSKLFHPDRGGDNEIMRQLQSQYDSWSLGYSYHLRKQHYNPINPFDHLSKQQINDYDVRIKACQEYISIIERAIVLKNNRIDYLENKVKTIESMTLWQRILYAIFGESEVNH